MFTTLLEQSLTGVVSVVSPIAFALLAFALVSQPWRDRVIGVLTGHRRVVDLVTGAVLLVISVYYLFAVFAVHELIL